MERGVGKRAKRDGAADLRTGGHGGWRQSGDNDGDKDGLCGVDGHAGVEWQGRGLWRRRGL